MNPHPCLANARCSCHTAGPSTPRRTTSATSNRTAPALLLAALVAPVLATPAPPPDLVFLYPALARRTTDAGQAPDDASSGFSLEQVEVEGLLRAGLPLKLIYDPSANLRSPPASSPNVELAGSNGVWVVDELWELHGKRFGPVRVLAGPDLLLSFVPQLSATPTADITDDIYFYTIHLDRHLLGNRPGYRIFPSHRMGRPVQTLANVPHPHRRVLRCHCPYDWWCRWCPCLPQRSEAKES